MSIELAGVIGMLLAIYGILATTYYFEEMGAKEKVDHRPEGNT